MTDSLDFTSNHDVFLAAQNISVLTSVELESGRVWVTPLFAQEGDMNAVSEKEISFSPACIPQGDVINGSQPGTPLSLLAIDLNQRKRYRINGGAKTAPDQSSGANLS